jgi:hypothetical protein
MQHNARTFALAMLFESGLGFAGLVVAWWANISLQSRLQVTSPALVRGLVACLPMLVLLVAMSSSRWPPLVQLRKQVEMLVGELFSSISWLELALVCFAAGLLLALFTPVRQKLSRGRCARCGAPIERGQSYCLDHLRQTVNEYQDQASRGEMYRSGRRG